MPFSVTCPSCGKSFQLAQEIYERKVAGKIVSIKCKQCQSGIRIDATEPGGLKVLGATPGAAATESVGAQPPGGAQAVRARQATLIGMMGPAGKPVTVGEAASEGALWAVDGGDAGEDREVDDATMAREIAAGTIGATTLVWREGMSDWLEVSKVPQLAKQLASARKAQEPPKVTAPFPAARAKLPSAPGIAAPAPAAPTPMAPTPVASAPVAPAPAARVPTPAAKAAPAVAAPRAKAPVVPSMVSEDDDDEATMIFRSSAEAVAKLGLGGASSESENEPTAPPVAAGRPVVTAPLPAAGRPAGASPAAGRAQSSPLNPPTPAAGRPPSAPLNPTPAAAPPPRAPATVPGAQPPPAPAAPPPMRAKQPSAPGLPRGLIPPPDPPAPPPPPPPPPNSSSPFAEPAAAPPPVRPRLASAPGLPRGLTPPPDPPAPPPVPPSPPPMAPFGTAAPPFVPTQNPFAGSHPSSALGQPMAQLAPNPFAVATTTDLEFTPTRRKGPLVIGAVILVLAAAGIAVAVTSSAPRPAPPPVPQAPPTPAADAPAAPATPNETPAPEAPAAHPSDDIAGTPRPTTSGGDFSQMFAAGAQKAQKGGPVGSPKAFDADEARTAIAAVLKPVAACKEPGGPTGQSTAAITFDATGHVSSVTIGAPFSGTSTGTCIITALKAAKVAPFNGLPGTVSQPVSLL